MEIFEGGRKTTEFAFTGARRICTWNYTQDRALDAGLSVLKAFQEIGCHRGLLVHRRLAFDG